ncbi:tetratricopeptide repeat protein [Sediminibacterium soli]|uniref:tetratricopeptide repeat protein n=1 Tax=Sediminibacterium soli TaxID=2698829 RepID=UPI00137A74E2|nr:tetratricopeptide repeat protein [Sediminibacterium soli]NCI45363.1 tetratricopeptide repeat protein [Sediminibacterium soli]
MKKQQWVLLGSALVLCILLFVFGKTVPTRKTTASPPTAQQHEHQSVSFETLLTQAKGHISAAQSERLLKLENAVVRGDVKEQQIHVYHRLARFWADSAHVFEPYAYYTGEAAKLENSEKSLTFAAHQFLDGLMREEQPAMQNWLAGNAKDLFEKALVINPHNDSSRIGLGACYIFGHISENPMEGILPIRTIVEKNPGNLYGQMILALGGKRSGQYDKAIERFLIIINKEPENVEATLNMAECYELKGDKANAVKWYERTKQLVKLPEAQTELTKRTDELKK